MTPPPAPTLENVLPLTTTSPDNSKEQIQTTNINGSNSNYNDGLTIVPPSQPIRIVDTGGPNNRYMKLNVLLGKGAYKTVWRALDREEGIEVAWNCITQWNKTELAELTNETEILKKVRHSNIINFYDSWWGNGEFLFITELMTSGTLREYFGILKNPTLKIIKRWARQVLKGLAYLHSHNPPIIHRDIKSDNLFINGTHGEVKIGDMGTAKMKLGKKYTVIGTPEFMAPEMYEEKGYSEKVDIYAFGMCLLEMCTGEYPYTECKNAAQIYKKVSQNIKPDSLERVENKEVLAIINLCLATEKERYSSKQLLDLSFFMEDPDVVLLGQAKDIITIQVHFRGTSEKHSVKFDFNLEKDSVESVVSEMVHEQILSSRLENYLCTELHKIIRENYQSLRLQSNVSVVNGSSGNCVTSNNGNGIGNGSTSTINTNTTIGTLITPTIANGTGNGGGGGGSANGGNGNGVIVDGSIRGSILIGNNGIGVGGSTNSINSSSAGFSPTSCSNDISAISRATSFNNQSHIMADAELEKVLTSRMQGYPDDMTIADFALDIANLAGRTAEKAREWAQSLEQQDIQTVGNLRALHEEDWTRINLTVFASRLLQNAIRGIPMCLSPKTTTRNDEMDECYDRSTTSSEPISPNGNANNMNITNTSITPFIIQDSNTISGKPKSPDNSNIVV